MSRLFHSAGLLLAFVLPPALSAQTLEPCPESRFGLRAECGTYPVWEDREAGGGRRIDIHFVILRAVPGKGREPVFMFAGGPGQGSTALVGLTNGALAPVGEFRDVVLVDQRGTGGSHPLLCRTEILIHPDVAFGHVFDPAVFRRCRAELAQRADLSKYTTDLAVGDLEDIRAFLGYDRVLLWGGSYGTRLAQAYARRHPEKVRALVLDGVVPFDFAAPATYSRTLQQALDRFLASCRDRTTCRDSFPALDEDFAGLVGRIGKGPVMATVVVFGGARHPVGMHLGDFGYAVRGILYSAAETRSLAGMIHRAARSGDLSEFAQRYWNRAAGFADFADGLHLSIFCAEDVPGIADGTADRLTEGTFIGRYLIEEYRGACAEWVRAAVDPAFHQPLSAPIPTLLLSGWFDPVTPPETAERVARALPASRHIVDPAGGHGVSAGCARPAVLHVLIHGTLDGLPAVCGAGP